MVHYDLPDWVDDDSWGKTGVYSNAGKLENPQGDDDLIEKAVDLWGADTGVCVAHYPNRRTWAKTSFHSGVPGQGHVAVEGNGSLENLLEHTRGETESVDGLDINTQNHYLSYLESPESPSDFSIWVADSGDKFRSGEQISEHGTPGDIDSYMDDIADELDDDKQVCVNIGSESHFKKDVAAVISYLNNKFPETAIMDANTQGVVRETDLLPQPDDGYISVTAESYDNSESDESQRTSSDDTGGLVSYVCGWFN